MPAARLSLRSLERQQFGFLISDILRLLRADFAERARDVPLTPALHRLLIFINRNRGCRQVELAAMLEVTPVTVGRMLDRLEKRGLIRRETHPGDRRATRVVVAPGARELLEQLDAARTLTRARAFTGLSERQSQELIASLLRIRDNLSHSSPAPSARRRPSSAKGRPHEQ